MTSPGETLRALADAVLPSPPEDDTAGAADVAAEHFVAHYLEFIRFGLTEELAAALDEAAATHVAAGPEPGLFATLSQEDRLHVLRALGSHDRREIRDAADAAVALVFAAFYGEWTGQDADGALVRLPVGWALVEWPGPAGLDPLPES